MSNIPSGAAAFNLNAILGPLMVGGLMSMILYGITCTQAFVYFQKSRSDRLTLKLFVTGIWMIDTFDIFLNGHILYWYFVKNYANPLAFISPVWSIVLHVSITSLSNFLVRTIFTHRVWRLSHGNWAIVILITLLSLVDLGCGIAITVKAFNITFVELAKFNVLLYLDFASSLSADAIIAFSLCYMLNKSRTGFGKTDSIINVLTLYTINTGLLTAIDATAGLITFAVMPNNFVYIAFYLQLSKLYVNAALASLNARSNLRDRNDDIVSIRLSDLSRTGGSLTAPAFAISGESNADKRADGLAILMDTQVDRVAESASLGRAPYRTV